jgi:hypothetical protein
VGRLIPGGLPIELETALLQVFAGLDSRVSALRNGTDIALASGDSAHCFQTGAESAADFEADLRAARQLASNAPPSTAAPGAPETGMTAVRAAYIHGSNWCCDSCGGFLYDAPMDVDWNAEIIAHRDVDAEVEFDAVFNGTYWQVTFPFAGPGVPPTPPAFRPDGLGFATFGDPPERVVARVEAVLGFPPTDDTGWVPVTEITGFCPGPNLRIVQFDNLGLLFSDGDYFAPEGTRHFVSYFYFGTPPLIDTTRSDGVNVGATVEDLLAVYPDAEIIPESGRFFGPAYVVGSDGELLFGQLTGVSPDDEITSVYGGVGCAGD